MGNVQMYGGDIFGTNCVPFNLSDCHLIFKIMSSNRDIRTVQYKIRNRLDYTVDPKNIWIVPFSEFHTFYECGKYIHWYFYSPSFSSSEDHEWCMRQRICHLIFIKYAKGTPQKWPRWNKFISNPVLCTKIFWTK